MTHRTASETRDYRTVTTQRAFQRTTCNPRLFRASLIKPPDYERIRIKMENEKSRREENSVLILKNIQIQILAE